MAPPLCKYFQQGNCRYGSACRFSHDRPSQTGGFGPGNTFSITKDSIRTDLMDDRPKWILSAYGPGKNAPEQLFGGYPREQSLEEIRLFVTQNGNSPEALQHVQNLYQEAESQMRKVLNDLDGAVQFVQAAADKHPNRIDMCERTNATQTNGSSPFGSGSGSGGVSGPSSNAFSSDNAFSSAPSGLSAPASSSNPFSSTTTQPSNPFGAPANQPLPFGAPAPSPFGAPQSETSAASSGFAKYASGTSGFGQTGAALSEPSGFAKYAAGGNAPSPFSQPASSGASGFAKYAQGSNASSFGQPASTTTNDKTNPFSTASTQPANPFGAPAPAPAPFGAPAPPASGFGSGPPTSAAPAANPFGAPAQLQNTPATANPFAQPAQPANGFSRPNPFGAPVSTPAPDVSMDTSATPTTTVNPFSKPMANGNANENAFATSNGNHKPFGQPNSNPQNGASPSPNKSLSSSSSSSPYPPGSTKEHPALQDYAELALNGMLRSFKNIRVVMNGAKSAIPASHEKPGVPAVEGTPCIALPNGSLSRIWNPSGAPTYNPSTEPEDPSEYTDDVRRAYQIMAETGRLQGNMPTCPPMRTDCRWDF